MKYILKKMTVLMVLVGFISFMTAVSFNGVEAKSERLMIQGDHGACRLCCKHRTRFRVIPWLF